MSFSIDRNKVTEGEIIEVSWAERDADTVTLTLDNGTNRSTITVDKEGTKKFRLNRVGKTTVTLDTTIKGKKRSKSPLSSILCRLLWRVRFPTCATV